VKTIVVLLMDTFRFDHLTKEITPNLIKISQDGVLYTNCLSGDTVTKDSMPYLLCGEPQYLPGVSIMARLKKYGYTSVVVSSNLIVNMYFGQGWAEVVDIRIEEAVSESNLRVILRKITTGRVFNIGRKIYRKLGRKKFIIAYARAKRHFDIVSSLLEVPATQFIWCHLMDPHSPYAPVKYVDDPLLLKIHDNYTDSRFGHRALTPLETDILRMAYRTELTEMDEQIGTFYRSVDWSDKILIITADHGEELGDHGKFGHEGDRFFRELQHVPLIVVNGRDKGIVGEDFHHKDFPDLVIEEALKSG